MRSKPIIVDGIETNYIIYENGDIKSLYINRIMGQTTSRDGYMKITLVVGKERKTFRVHRLVALAFLSNPNNLEQINHIDGNKSNNHYSNLEWCTRSHNNKHAYDLELNYATGKKQVAQYDISNKLLNIFESLSEAARALEKPISATSNIGEVCRGNRKSAFGFKWRYIEEA